MALFRKPVKNNAEIPTASMSDIAFLLLIFFMVSTVFSNEVGLQIVLPGKGETVKVKSSNIAKIYVKADGTVNLNGNPIKVKEIALTAKKMLVENDSLIFSIKTQRAAKYQMLISVFDQLRMANAERISFAPSGKRK